MAQRSPAITLAGQDSPGRPVCKLGDVARSYVFKPDSEPRTKLSEVPQDVAQFQGQSFPIGVRDMALPVPEDLLHPAGNLPRLVRQPQRGIDDGVIGGNHCAGTGCRLLVSVKVEDARDVLVGHDPSVPSPGAAPGTARPASRHRARNGHGKAGTTVRARRRLRLMA
jgi:hypothetical protein